LAFIAVVAVTVYQVAGKELKNTFNKMSELQTIIQQKSLEGSQSTD